ncbi:MAG: OmpL47-type beta-barrel domain-containing protein, partial [Promethearchaeota archaeon]
MFANDTAGNMVQQAYQFEVDNTEPTIILTSPSDGSTVKDSDVIDLDITDAQDNLHVTWYNWDGITNVTFFDPWQITISGLSDGLHTLNVFANDTAGNMVQQVYQFEVDNTEPTIALTSPSNGSTVKDSDVIDLDITDALGNLHVTWYNWDGGINVTFFDPWQITISGLSEGLHTLNVFANDTMNNLDHQIYQFEVDNTPPTIILTSPSDGSTVKDSDIIDLDIADAQDNLHVTWYNWDGITNVTFFDPWQITISGLSDGLHTLNVFANDTAGNMVQQAYQFEVDNTAPFVFLNTPGNLTILFGDNYAFDATITDAHPSYVWYNWDGGANSAAIGSPWDFTIDTTVLTDGWHDFWLYADDTLGHENVTHYRFLVDNTGLSVYLTNPANETALSGDSYAFDAEIFDANPGYIWYKWDDGANSTAIGSPWDFTIDTTLLADGWHDFWLYANDSAGHETVTHYRFEVDNILPTVYLNSPANESIIYGAAYSFDGQVDDTHASYLWYNWDSGANSAAIGSPWDFTIDTTLLADGWHDFWLYANDTAGNENVTHYRFRIDNTSPQTMITLSGTPGLDTWYISDVTVTLSATDNISGVATTAYSFDYISWITYTGPFNVITEGTTTIFYNSTDNAGNVETTNIKIIRIDKTSPTTTIGLTGTSGQGGWYTSDVTVTLSATDATSAVLITAYSLDGINWVDYTVPFTITVEGSTTVYYNSTDNAGNVENTHTIPVNIDTTAPTTTISLEGTIGQNGWYVSDVTVTFLATDDTSDVAVTAYSLDGITWNTYLGPFDITTEGIITLRYNSTDNAGNVETTDLMTIKIDKTLPTTTIGLTGTSGQGGWYTSDVTVTLSATDDTSAVFITAYSLDGITWNTYLGPFDITTEGIITLRYNSTDNAGNVETTDLMAIKIDKTPPDITITIPPSDGEVYTGVIWINGTFDDTISQITSISINDTRFSQIEPLLGTEPYGITGTFSFSATVTETGEFIVEIIVQDEAGHTDSETRYVMLINTPPGTNVLVTDPIT